MCIFLIFVWGSGKREEKKQIKTFELSTYSRSLEQAEYHTFKKKLSQ